MTLRRKDFLDLRHPFFRPVWRRVAVVIVLALWTVAELIGANFYWAALAGGLLVYVLYVFFLDFSLPEGKARK